MRIKHFDARRLRRWIAAGAALAAASLTRCAVRADDSPSLARAISYESAEVWPNDGSRALVESAYYASANTVEASAATLTDASVEPADAACPTCSPGGANYGGEGGGAFPYNRCGCSSQALFPWFTGPGNCDSWCVGPHWEVAVDGLIMFRDTVDWSLVPPGVFTLELADQFDAGPGARIFVTAYNQSPFGLQVGYEGVNDFHASAQLANGGDRRDISYESNINSVELNFVRRTNSRWRPFAGVRYIELDDDFVDFVTVQRTIPAPSDPPAPPTAFVDAGESFFLDNRLIGLQGGAFRDVWRLTRWLTIEPFGNAGVYFNDFKRANLQRTVTTVITGDDLSTPGNEFSQVTTEVQTGSKQEFSDVAFVGEAGVTGVVRLSRCVALRGGYQVLAVDRVGQGIDAFLAPGFNGSTLVYHGGHFGVEYVR
jgi:hypothetical protein